MILGGFILLQNLNFQLGKTLALMIFVVPLLQNSNLV